MKTTYTILLLILATTLIHAQEPTKWNPERTPFATGIRRDGARTVSTTAATEIAPTANKTTFHQFLQPAETLPDFTLSSGDFLTMSNFGLLGDGGTDYNGDGWLELPASDPDNALKIPAGDGIYILLLLVMGYGIVAAYRSR